MTSVQVQFFCKEEKYAIEEDATLLVPVSLNRSGLNKLLHHFLPEEDRISFEFLIDGTLLDPKCDLKTVLSESGRTTEKTLQIEYIPSLPEPKQESGKLHNDWVSCVEHIHECDLMISGDFGGSLYLWNSGSKKMLHCLKISEKPVKAVTVFKPAQYPGSIYVVVGGLDQQVSLLKLDERKRKFEFLSASKGHSDSILSLASDSSMIFSSSHAGEILCWTLNDDGSDLNMAGTLGSNKMAVTGISISSDSKWLVSGGLDRSINYYDFSIGSVTKSFTSDTAVIDLCTGKDDDFLSYSCHSDCIIRVWDHRLENSTCQKIVTKSIYNSCISAKSANGIVCGSFDGSANLYDIRSPKHAILTLAKQQNDNRIFCCDYSSSSSSQQKGSLISFGSEDKMLHTFSL